MSDEPTPTETDHNALVGALFLPGDEPTPAPDADAPLDFDGGVREPVPPAPDPVNDHDRLIADLLGPQEPGAGF